MQMIMYNSLLFPTLSIAYVMLIIMYFNGSLLNCQPPLFVLCSAVFSKDMVCQQITVESVNVNLV